jgi:hypothetical protein
MAQKSLHSEQYLQIGLLSKSLDDPKQLPNMNIENEKSTQDTEAIMEQVNQLIVKLKTHRVLDPLFAVIIDSDHCACLDSNTLR